MNVVVVKTHKVYSKYKEMGFQQIVGCCCRRMVKPTLIHIILQ